MTSSPPLIFSAASRGMVEYHLQPSPNFPRGERPGTHQTRAARGAAPRDRLCSWTERQTPARQGPARSSKRVSKLGLDAQQDAIEAEATRRACWRLADDNQRSHTRRV